MNFYLVPKDYINLMGGEETRSQFGTYLPKSFLNIPLSEDIFKVAHSVQGNTFEMEYLVSPEHNRFLKPQTDHYSIGKEEARILAEKITDEIIRDVVRHNFELASVFAWDRFEKITDNMIIECKEDLTLAKSKAEKLTVLIMYVIFQKWYKDYIRNKIHTIIGEKSEEWCFVIQPFDKGGEYDQKYDEIIYPAIDKCGLIPYRVDRDPQVEETLETIKEKISHAALIIAEISLDNPNVWFELGYATACNKSIILLCDERIRTGKLPFDISHRKIIFYRSTSDKEKRDAQKLLTLTIGSRYNRQLELRKQDSLTPEELLILKFLARDQKTPFAMTPEEKITNQGMSDEMKQDCLNELLDKQCVTITCSTTTGDYYYQVTRKGKKALSKK